MASAKSGVHVLQLKPVEVPDFLQRGQRCFKFDDVDTSSAGSFVFLRVDPKGHVVYWTSTSSQSTDYLEIMYILDTRCGRSVKAPKDVERARDKLCPSFVPTSSFEGCLMTIVTGNNFVDLKFTTFVAPSPQDAQEWTDAVFKIAYNLLSLNGSVMHFIGKSYAKVRYATAEREVRVNDVMDAFASHRDDRKRIELALQSAKLPSGKDDVIPVDHLTEEHFLLIYRYLTQRSEVERIFQDIQSMGSAHGGGRRQGSNNNNQQAQPQPKTSVITVGQFVQFLNTYQRDPRLNEILYPFYTNRSASRLIEQYEPNHEFSSKGLMTLDGFMRYLLGEDNRVLSEEYLDLRIEDMNEPLSHYAMSSSHNTYLTGPQATLLALPAKSSAEMYRQVLLAGCRSIELDCWDGKTGTLVGQPVITHGPVEWTRVPELPFRDVVEAIFDSAFKTSEYPVILSLDVKSKSAKVQERIAELFREIFKDMLLTEPMAEYSLDPGNPLPPPSMLKRKILVKCRKTGNMGSRQASWKGKQATSFYTDYTASGSGTVQSGDWPSDSGVGIGAATSATVGCQIDRQPTAHASFSDSTNDGFDSGETPGTLGGSMSGSSTLTFAAQQVIASEVVACGDDANRFPDSDYDSESDSSTAAADNILAKSSKSFPNAISEELSALANYFSATKLKSFEDAEKRNMSCEICSFNEHTATDHIRRNVSEFVNFNKRQISRIYPAGTRITSNNYIPQMYWNVGCQMVALNFQTLDALPMQLNQGLFEMNGRSGYLLKPECMRRRDRHFDPLEENAVENVVANTVTVLVISGQFLSKSRVSTYVEIEMYGLPADTVKRRRTITVPNNGINPVYSDLDGRVIEFTKVILPDMASIRFCVYIEGGRMLGHRILPVTALRPGYRHISLRNAMGQPLGLATLFVKIGVKDFVPEAHQDLVRALLSPIDFVNKLNDSVRDIADALVNPIDHVKKMEQREKMINRMIEDTSTTVDGQGSLDKAEEPGEQVRKVSLPKPIVNGVTQALKNEKSSSASSSKTHLNAICASERTLRKTESEPPSPEKDKQQFTLPKKSYFKLGATKPVISAGGALDGYKLTTPSMEALDKDKNIQRLIRKHDKELQGLRVTHEKERAALEKKHQRKRDELKRLQERALDLLTQVNEKAIKKATKELGEVTDIKAQAEYKKNRLKLDHKKEELQLNEKHKRETRALFEKQWLKEWDAKRDTECSLCTARTLLVDESLKVHLRRLEELYQRDICDARKQAEDMRKSKRESLLKSNLDKEQFNKQKSEHEKWVINQGVDKRRRLETAKDALKLELLQTHEMLKEAIVSKRDSRNADLKKLYDEQMTVETPLADVVSRV